jgi:hypothetical protein
MLVLAAICAILFWPSGREERRAIEARPRDGARPDNAEKIRLSLLSFMEHSPRDAVAGSIIVIVPDPSDFEAFLDSASRAGVDLRRPVPELGIALVQAPQKADRERLLDCMPARSLLDYDFSTFCPDLAELSLPGDQVSWGEIPGSAIGVPDDVNWGKGVRLALLDTRVGPHYVLAASSIVQYGGAGLSAGAGWHGTAMASVICGRDASVTGVSPSVQLMAFPVLGADGSGDV